MSNMKDQLIGGLSNCCEAPVLQGDMCSDCKEHCEVLEQCPKCNGVDVGEHFYPGSFHAPECYYVKCESCGHEWNHS